MRRSRVLISAYACEPGRGSEPGIGWNTARAVASHHEVWVMTRSNNRPKIEAELTRKPVSDLHLVYFDLPSWARWWKRGKRGIHLYYYLWQFGAYGVARKLHRKIGFDLSHHATFVNYWKPSLLPLLDIPFMWGPVGGGESAPKAFWHDFSGRGMIYEAIRYAARRMGELDPLVKICARRSAVAVATTKATAARLTRLGARNVKVLTQVGLSAEEIEHLQQQASHLESQSVRFVSVGRLLHWKGVHLGLQAFAQANLEDAEYWVVGDGPERERLQTLAAKLEVAHSVRFWGALPRKEALRRIGECQVLVHPSLHDSGGLVCLEAMAGGLPVICLDLGGPALQVTDECGFKVPASNPEQVVKDLAAALRTLAEDHDLRARMGKASQRRVVEHFSWSSKGELISEMYGQVLTR